MELFFKRPIVYRQRKWQEADVLVRQGRIVSVSAPSSSVPEGAVVLHCAGQYLFPGLVDVHVHLREPGFSYKETIATGTAAAAHGGFTSVCAMPNLSPVPDSPAHLAEELEKIRQEALVRVYPYAAITRGEQGEELADLAALSRDAVAFSDDGRGVQTEEMMGCAMTEVRRLGKLIAAHCEDNRLLHGGYIHDGEYARTHGHRGICSESEWGPIRRDLRLAGETGCAYHVCHISTKESVALIRGAKASGIDVTCETAPHYLVLNDAMLEEDGRFKMNPPIRSEEDRQALLEGLRDGTIDMIATDHAPHSAEEKSRGLAGSLMGVSGLETSFPVLYTCLVRSGILSLEQLLERMHDHPARRFGIGGKLEPGEPADLTLFDLDSAWTVDPEAFLSRGKSTPFAGRQVFGRCLLTLVEGRTAYQAPEWVAGNREEKQ